MKDSIILILFTLVFLAPARVLAQGNLFIPNSINSPLFGSEKETLLGAKFNNYGLNLNAARKSENTLIIFSIQGNSGSLHFNPLGINQNLVNVSGSEFIQPEFTEMLYAELGFGHDFRLINQKLNIYSGFGQQIINSNTRFFMQLDWGNEGRLINTGLTVRSSITQVRNIILVIWEPAIQAKFKLGDFRIVNQFGYALTSREKEYFSNPVFSLGFEYGIK